MAVQYASFDDTYKMYAWRDNRRRLVVTQGEGLSTDSVSSSTYVKTAKFQLRDEQGIISLPDSTTAISLALRKNNGSEVLVSAFYDYTSSSSVKAEDRENGIVYFAIKQSMTDVPGDITGEIRLTTSAGVVKFYGVNFYVFGGVSSNAAIQSDDFEHLVNALNKVEAVTVDDDVVIAPLDEIIEQGGLHPVASGVIYDYLINNYVPLTREIAGIPLDDDIDADDLREAISSPKVTVGNVAPTKQTAGNIGDFYVVRLNPSTSNWIYQCKAINDNNGSSEYLWVRMVQSSDIDKFVSNTLTIAGIALNANISKDQLAKALEGYSVYTVDANAAPVLTANSTLYPIPTLWRQIENGSVTHIYLLTARTPNQSQYDYEMVEFALQEHTSSIIEWDNATCALNDYCVPVDYEGKIGDRVIVTDSDGGKHLWELQNIVFEKDYYSYWWHEVTNQNAVNSAMTYADNLFNSVHMPDLYSGLTDKSNYEYTALQHTYYVGDFYVNTNSGDIWKCTQIEFDSEKDLNNLPPWKVTWTSINKIYKYPISTTLTIAVQDWDDNQYELPSALVTLADGRNKADVDIDSQTLNTLIGDGCIGLYVSTDTSGVSPVFTLNAIGNEPLHEITIQITFSQLIEVVQEVGE